jgi:hypothetical protein
MVCLGHYVLKIQQAGPYRGGWGGAAAPGRNNYRGSNVVKSLNLFLCRNFYQNNMYSGDPNTGNIQFPDKSMSGNRMAIGI